jgi:hydroxyacylglutathione hydrolase
MTDIEIQSLPAMGDNYIYLLVYHDAVIVVDPGLAAPVQTALRAQALKLTHILLTHHHADHTAGCHALAGDCEVIGPKDTRVPWATRAVGEGDSFEIADLKYSVLDVPGHTDPHLAFHVEHHLFCGDSLFAGGCGRLFEGSPAQMWNSLLKIRSLDDDTIVYCGHEYTLNNLEFAVSIEPGNSDLARRLEQVRQQREAGVATVPFRLGEDKLTNPFLRVDDAELQVALGATDAVTAFAELRARKDRW